MIGAKSELYIESLLLEFFQNWSCQLMKMHPLRFGLMFGDQGQMSKHKLRKNWKP